jgi:hypothetical protein
MITNARQLAKRKMDMLFVRGDGVILVGYTTSSPAPVYLTPLADFSPVTNIISMSSLNAEAR